MILKIQGLENIMVKIKHFLHEPFSGGHKRRYLLSGEEEQHISLIFLTHVDLDDRANGCFQVVPLRLGRVEDLHGMRPAGNGQQGAAVEINLELSSVQSGAHYNDLGRNT